MDRDKDDHPDTIPDVGSAPTLVPPGETLATRSPGEAVATVEVAGALLERYRLDAVLGLGGMGEVISARDEQIGRSVAIKRMRAKNPTPEALARFLREARIQGRLEHPAVVPVHEVRDDEGGQPFFVMKQLAGTTLADVIARLREPEIARRFPRQRLLRAFVDVCLAIEFAHTRGIVHRDLKPANIMLGDFGEVYVLDWGIARVLAEATGRESFTDVVTLDGDGTLAGSLLGTPGYMAPEQIEGAADLDGRADVYALGCILFEVLAQTALHPRANALQSTLTGADARPSQRALDIEVPLELENICITATRTRPAERFATARELGDAVQRFLDGDRDFAARRERAKTELAIARAALDHGGTDERKVATQSAARALALDPANRDSADLVGRLMLEPPRDEPPEVALAMAAEESKALQAARPLVGGAALTVLAFVPVFWWIGMRGTWYLAILAICAGGIATLAIGLRGSNPLTMGRIVLCGWLVVITTISIITTPFLVAPGVLVVVAMSIATHPSIIRGPLLFALLASSALIPWLLAFAGVLPHNVEIIGNTVVLHTLTDQLAPTGTLIALGIYIAALTGMAVVLAGSLVALRRTAERKVLVQAWQLRQLVPRAEA